MSEMAKLCADCVWLNADGRKCTNFNVSTKINLVTGERDLEYCSIQRDPEGDKYNYTRCKSAGVYWLQKQPASPAKRWWQR